MNIRELTIDELEDKIIDGDEEAIGELARRYREGDRVTVDNDMAETYERMIGEGRDKVSSNGFIDHIQSDSGNSLVNCDSEMTDRSIWQEQYNEMRGQIAGAIRTKAREGNPAALVVLAEKYLASSNQSENGEGLDILTEAEKILRGQLANNSSSTIKEALATVFSVRGEYYERKYVVTKDSLLAEKAFEAYSNANEIDQNQTAGLARCYRDGIGVEQNIYKANEYEEQGAINGGIREKYNVAINAQSRNETIRTVEWLQTALMADDAKNHPVLTCVIRYLLAKLNEKDEQGKLINKDEELDKLEKLLASNNAEAALYLADFSEDPNKKAIYYEKGKDGLPEKYAKLCEKKYSVVIANIERQQREESARAEIERREAEERAEIERREAEEKEEKERIAQEKAAEEERLIQEALAQEELKRKEEIELLAKRKKRTIRACIAVMVLLVLVFGAFRLVNTIKAKQEAAELASMSIELERTIKVNKNAYSYDSYGNKVLTLDENTVDVELKTQNPKPKAISKEDWASLASNYKVSSSVPDGVMRNGVEVTVTTEPKNQSVIDGFQKKYGCNVTEKKVSQQYKTDGFTENVTNGSEFKNTKGDVLEEMKKVCSDDAKTLGATTGTRILNTYFLCPSPQRNNYENAVIVVTVRATQKIYSDTDYIYLFHGPFGSNYDKSSVNASWADRFEEYYPSDGYDLEAEVLSELKGYEDSLEWKYEWQEMD